GACFPGSTVAGTGAGDFHSPRWRRVRALEPSGDAIAHVVGTLRMAAGPIRGRRWRRWRRWRAGDAVIAQRRRAAGHPRERIDGRELTGPADRSYVRAVR